MPAVFFQADFQCGFCVVCSYSLSVGLCFFGSLEDTTQQNYFIHLQLNHAVEIVPIGQQDVIKRHSLGQGSRKSVLPLTFVYTEYGKPHSKKGFGNDFARWVKDAGLPDRCRLHGLKKGGMRQRAEAENTTHELMATSGHKTLAEVERYTREADKKRLAKSGAAKMRPAQAHRPALPTDQTGKRTEAESLYTNTTDRLHKHGDKSLKGFRWKHDMALPNPCFSLERDA